MWGAYEWNGPELTMEVIQGRMCSKREAEELDWLKDIKETNRPLEYELLQAGTKRPILFTDANEVVCEFGGDSSFYVCRQFLMRKYGRSIVHSVHRNGLMQNGDSVFVWVREIGDAVINVFVVPEGQRVGRKHYIGSLSGNGVAELCTRDFYRVPYTIYFAVK